MRKIMSASLLTLVSLPGFALATGQTTLASVGSAGGEANGVSFFASISTNGRYVVFTSGASNLVAGDTNGYEDIFVHDRQTGKTERVNISSTGEQANSYIGFGNCSSISADGRYVTFQSGATNLVSDDTNGRRDIFIHDRRTGKTTRASVDNTGKQGNSDSYCPVISADGRYVVFESAADNLVAGDTNGFSDIFIHDQQTNETTRISVSSAGKQSNWDSSNPSISADGRYIAFDSFADNLMTEDTNGSADVFMHDRQTGKTTLVSTDSAGKQGNAYNGTPSISANGRYVSFVSGANNLIAGDTNQFADIFIHDQQTGRTERVSVNNIGEQSNGGSNSPAISADGRYVVFISRADNLVAGDTNGETDVFVHDRQTGKTTRANVDSDGRQAISPPGYGEPSISADGRYVSFDSWGNDLATGQVGPVLNVFVRDRLIQTQNQSDVSLVLSGPTAVAKGSDAIYKFTITNNGGINAGHVHLIGIISSQGQLKSIAPSQGVCRPSAVPVCRLGTLIPGQSATVTANVTINGRITIKASAQSAPKDNLPSNNAKSITTKIQ